MKRKQVAAQTDTCTGIAVPKNQMKQPTQLTQWHKMKQPIQLRPRHKISEADG